MSARNNCWNAFCTICVYFVWMHTGNNAKTIKATLTDITLLWDGLFFSREQNRFSNTTMCSKFILELVIVYYIATSKDLHIYY